VRSERERGRAGGASETDCGRIGSLNEREEEGLSEDESRGADSVGVGGLDASDRVGEKKSERECGRVLE
jgi:hypothetical protein